MSNIEPGLSPQRIRFGLATRETGHFGKFTADHPRVTVRPSECPVAPLHPEDAGYWGAFLDVVEEVGQAKSKASYQHEIAACFEKFGIRRADQAARIVAGDWTTDLILIIAKAIVQDPDCVWNEIVPGPFVDKMPLMVRLFGELAHVVAANSGAFKWENELARPQEIAWRIANGLMDCPSIVGIRLKQLKGYDEMTKGPLKTHSRFFTLDGIGAPPHCSWIAMHSSAVEAAAYALRVMVKMTGDRRDETILGVTNVGGFRKTLGVHYEQDNLAGYWLGQETAKRYLPKFFSQFADADLDLLAEAMKAAEVDWLATY